VVVALDPGHEGAAEAVDRERSRHVQRLAGLDVRRDLVVAHVGEVHDGRAGRACRSPGRRVGQEVTGVQDAHPTAHGQPAPHGLVRVRRLAEGLAVQLEHRVAAEHQAVTAHLPGDRGGLQLRQPPCQLGRAQPGHLRLVDTRDDHGRLDASGPERREASR
jgi:hypothetical protein